jgi:hypothetical protein
MRLLRLIVISFLVLGTLITAISALFPNTVMVSRAMEMGATAQQIQHYTTDLNEWNKWMSDWKENKAVWKDSTVYIGTQTIRLKTKTDSSVTYDWVAKGQRPYIVKFEWFPTQKGIYVVHWSFEQHVKWYPWEKFQTLLNEKVLGFKMEMELANLRDVMLDENSK